MKDESIIPQARGSLATGTEETEEGGSCRRRTGIEADSKNRTRRVALMPSDASIRVKCQTIGLHRSQSTIFFTTHKFTFLKKVTFLLRYFRSFFLSVLFLKLHFSSI